MGHGKRHTTEAPFKDILSTTEDSLEPDQLPQKNNSNWKSQSCLKKKKKKKLKSWELCKDRKDMRNSDPKEKGSLQT